MRRKVAWPLILFPPLIAGACLMLQPSWLINGLHRVSPGVIYSVETDLRAIALTIDDGPDRETTPRILDLLARHRARATFFVVTDHIAGNEALLTRIVEEGHELGNHLTADEPSILLGPEGFERDVKRAHELLARYAEIRWLRPGSGWYNGSMLETARRQGYQVAMGSIYPFDALLPSSWFAARYILWRAQPGSIIVLHDVGSRGERTLAALEQVLPVLADRGYAVVTLSELEAQPLSAP